mgnify:CR=1 FL=1
MNAAEINTVLDGAKCVDSTIPRGMQLPVLIYIFSKLANMQVDPQVLIDQAKCINAYVPAGLQLSVLILLASYIQQGQVQAYLQCGSGAPTIPPYLPCQMYFDNGPSSPTAGSIWIADYANSQWIQIIA